MKRHWDSASMISRLVKQYSPEHCESLLAANPGACESLYDRIMKMKAVADVADHTGYVMRALLDGPKTNQTVAAWCRQNGDPGMDGALAQRICERLVREGRASFKKDGQVYSTAASDPVAGHDEELAQIARNVEALGDILRTGNPTLPPIAADVELAEPEPIPTAVVPRVDPRLAARRLQPPSHDSVWPAIMERCVALMLGHHIKVDVPPSKFRNAFAQDVRNRLNAAATKQWAWNVTQGEGDWVVVTKRGPNPNHRAAAPTSPTTETLESPAVRLETSHDSKTIRLEGGGTLTLSGTLEIFSLTSSDRQFVFDLIDKMDSYVKANSSREAR